MEKNKKPEFPQGDIDKAVNYHLLDRKLTQNDPRPPYCVSESDIVNNIYSMELCPRLKRVFACDLCNPHRKI